MTNPKLLVRIAALACIVWCMAGVAFERTAGAQCNGGCRHQAGSCACEASSSNGPCTFGVEGSCAPKRATFGHHQTTWRKWKEPAPYVPKRPKRNPRLTDGGALDLPTPSDESESNPGLPDIRDLHLPKPEKDIRPTSKRAMQFPGSAAAPMLESPTDLAPVEPTPVEMTAVEPTPVDTTPAERSLPADASPMALPTVEEPAPPIESVDPSAGSLDLLNEGPVQRPGLDLGSQHRLKPRRPLPQIASHTPAAVYSNGSSGRSMANPLRRNAPRPVYQQASHYAPAEPEPEPELEPETEATDLFDLAEPIPTRRYQNPLR